MVTGILIFRIGTLKHCYSLVNYLKINLPSCLSVRPAPYRLLCAQVSRVLRAFLFSPATSSSSSSQSPAGEPTTQGRSWINSTPAYSDNFFSLFSITIRCSIYTMITCIHLIIAFIPSNFSI